MSTTPVTDGASPIVVTTEAAAPETKIPAKSALSSFPGNDCEGIDTTSLGNDPTIELGHRSEIGFAALTVGEKAPAVQCWEYSESRHDIQEVQLMVVHPVNAGVVQGPESNFLVPADEVLDRAYGKVRPTKDVTGGGGKVIAMAVPTNGQSLVEVTVTTDPDIPGPEPTDLAVGLLDSFMVGRS
ncbi:hypothetical protein ACLH0K_08995 [Arthrobacter sp. MPF02]|uniref:hypothetical protein n=1 Tax=Arthrobacter sp. MPF02 TaxID=3388492 RepID=UPI0039856039